MVLHPQAAAALEQWAQGPAVTDPGFDLDEQRRCARAGGGGRAARGGRRASSTSTPTACRCRLYLPRRRPGPARAVRSCSSTAAASSSATSTPTTRRPAGWRTAPAGRCSRWTTAARPSTGSPRPPTTWTPPWPGWSRTATGPGRRRRPARRPRRQRRRQPGPGGRPAQPHLFAASVLVYPFLDPRLRFESYRREAGGTRPAGGAWYWQQYAARPRTSSDPDLAPLLSGPLGTLPPTLVVAAEHDPAASTRTSTWLGRLAAAGRRRSPCRRTPAWSTASGATPSSSTPPSIADRRSPGSSQPPPSDTLRPMRVHLGSDHAGLELKEHLLGWLADQGHEPVDHGPFVYDAVDDYPLFCLRAAEAVAADRRTAGQPRHRDRRLRQRRADRGQQGHRHPRGPGVERGDRRARPRAQRRQRHLRRRPHALASRSMTRFIEVFLDHRPSAGDERHDRRIASSPTYEKTGNLPPLPESALGHQSDRGRMPEGHTLHRLADDLGRASPAGRSRSRARRAGSPRPPRSWTARAWSRARRRGASTCSSEFEGDRFVHVHLGLYGTFRVGDGAGPGAGRPGAAASGARRGRGSPSGVRRPAGRHHLRAGHRGAARGDRGRLGPDPLRAAADPGAAWRADLPQPHADRRAADGPDGRGRCGQRLPGGGAVPAPASTRCGRATPCAAGSSTRSGRTWSSLMAEGVATGRIDTVRPEHAPEAMGRPPRRDDHGGEVYVYRRHEQPCHVCSARVRTEVLAGRNSFWCPRCQPVFRSRARGANL